MQEFIINEHIKLRLENGITNIYVEGKMFRQCKFLLLFISKENSSSSEEIGSIDEFSEHLDFSLDPDTEYIDQEKQEIIDSIKPETEFWAHCSNFQAWAENNYDSRILHRNLAFPLLRRLTEAGDSVAQKKFKEEIGERYFSGVRSVQTYLEEEGYLKYLNKDEIRSFIHSGADVIDELETIIGIDLELTTLPENFTHALIKNGEIAGVDLSHLDLEELPDCILGLRHLEILNLVGNKLTEISEWIGELKSLKKLIAVNNKIKKIPESIGNLLSLEFLDLAVNELEMLPESVGNLLNLKELSLYDNKIKILPDSIGNLKSLERLFVGENLLNNVPETIGNLNRLQSLNLGSNPIKSLPVTICELPSLKILEVRETQIEKENKILIELKKKKVEVYV